MCIRWRVKDLKGMSDLCIYELQDNVWDEFGESDDHIVPHPPDEAEDQCVVRSDSRKKLRLQVAGVTSNADSGTNSVVLGRKETNSETLTKEEKMLEKDAWSHAPDGMFAGSCGNLSSKERSVASDDSRMSAHCLKSNSDGVFCSDDHVIDERCAAVDNNMYSYSLNHISPTESNLNFFNHEDKESNDLYYGWPDIGNFEDVDKMFRSCDSTFGVGSLSNDDDLGWFSTSQAIEGSEDAIKSEFEHSCLDSEVVNRASETCEDSLPHGNVLSHNDPRKKSATMCDDLSMQVNGSCETAAIVHTSSMNGSSAQSESNEDSVSDKEMNKHKKQSNLQNRSELKRKDRYPENGGSSQHHSLLVRFPHAEVPFSDSSNQMQDEFTHTGYFHHANQISGCSTLSSVKSDDQLCPTPKESSYSSNQVQSMEVSLARNFNPADVTSPNASICDPDAVLKSLHPNENGIDNHNNGEVSLGVLVDMDSSLVQESSCVSSALNEYSLEAASFRQLQRVMEQLDIKTKLCIRDSLYRLARSAEQRHNGVIPIIDSKNGGAHSELTTAEETSKCNGLMDMETDTNPIDRSVAHLLFHRPSDPSVLPGSNASSPKSHVMVHKSVTSQPVKNEGDTGQEEEAVDTQKVS